MINNRKFCKFTIAQYDFEPQPHLSKTLIRMTLNDIDNRSQKIHIETFCHPARERLLNALLREYAEKTVPVTLNFVYKIVSYETLPELKGLI